MTKKELERLQLNIKCKERIEELIKENFDGYHLNSSAALTALPEHGERVESVLAMTVQEKEYDGRFSVQNKEWARSIHVCLDKRCIVDSHPAVLDGFIDQIRNWETDAAYRIPDGYIHIQTSSEGGYDYTFYDQNFRELDGGIYDNPDVSMKESLLEILQDYFENILDGKISIQELVENGF